MAAGDKTTIQTLQLKLSNLYSNGRVIVYADGTMRLVRDLIEYAPRENDDYYPVKYGDIITQIAYQYYKDQVLLPSHYWWIIADANKIRHPLVLDSYIGKQIIIPNILNFKLANQ